MAPDLAAFRSMVRYSWAVGYHTTFLAALRTRYVAQKSVLQKIRLKTALFVQRHHVGGFRELGY